MLSAAPTTTQDGWNTRAPAIARVATTTRMRFTVLLVRCLPSAYAQEVRVWLIYQNASAAERFFLRLSLAALAFPVGMLVMLVRS